MQNTLLDITPKTQKDLPVPVVSPIITPVQRINSTSTYEFLNNDSNGLIKSNNKPYYIPSQQEKVNIIEVLTKTSNHTHISDPIYQNLNMIPAYAAGTPRNQPITTPTVALVGENGPEHIVPARKLNIDEMIVNNSNIDQTARNRTNQNNIDDSDLNADLGKLTIGSLSDTGNSLDYFTRKLLVSLPKIDGWYE